MAVTGAIDTIEWERDFKVLCDGLLRFELGRLIQTFASDGSDGGVDAEFNGTIDQFSGRWVFQYKFRSPKEALSKRRAWLCERYRQTKTRPSEFDRKGVKHADGYVLLTNVPVTTDMLGKLKVEWRTRGHEGPLCVWDPSSLSVLMKGREHLARTWSGAKEARCLRDLMHPLYAWVEAAQCVAGDWSRDPLWPQAFLKFEELVPLRTFQRSFESRPRRLVEPRDTALRLASSHPLFRFAADTAFPRALQPFEAVVEAVSALSSEVMRNIEQVRDEINTRLPQLHVLDDKTRAEASLLLAYSVLEYRWGFPTRGIHSIQDGRLIVHGQHLVWEPSIDGIIPVLDELYQAVPHGRVDEGTERARASIVRLLDEWWPLLWQVVAFGVDAHEPT